MSKVFFKHDGIAAHSPQDTAIAQEEDPEVLGQGPDNSCDLIPLENILKEPKQDLKNKTN